jgi:hypothetical protein
MKQSLDQVTVALVKGHRMKQDGWFPISYDNACLHLTIVSVKVAEVKGRWQSQRPIALSTKSIEYVVQVSGVFTC